MSERATNFIHRPETSAELLAMDRMLTLRSDIVDGRADDKVDVVTAMLRAYTEQGIDFDTLQRYFSVAGGILKAETAEAE